MFLFKMGGLCWHEAVAKTTKEVPVLENRGTDQFEPVFCLLFST